MASAFASQLSQIALKSMNELDLKAQKASHSESLIFEKKVAGAQDFETIYQICLEGFRDLCELDVRFRNFERNLFSPQSKSQDRAQMTAKENEALTSVLEEFLQLVGGRLLLRPAIKALEWLVRRFRVHVYNTSFLILTFLPYYETPIFRNLLSILLSKLPIEHKFLNPYLKSATNPPRHAVAYSATSSDGFFDVLNNYTLKICQYGASHSMLLSLWSGITTEAVAGRLGLAQSGRREVQQQRQEDVLLRVLPILNKGLGFDGVAEMKIALYTICMILATKSSLSERVLDSLMQAVASSISPETANQGVICLVVLATQKTIVSSSDALVDALMDVAGLQRILQSLQSQYEMKGLLQILVVTALNGMRKRNFSSRIEFVGRLIRIAPTTSVVPLLTLVMTKILDIEDSDPVKVTQKARLVAMVHSMHESEEFSSTITSVILMFGNRTSELESILSIAAMSQTVIMDEEEPETAMEIDQIEDSGRLLQQRLDKLPQRTADEHSFFSTTPSHLFPQLLDTFVSCCSQRNGVAKFAALPLWKSVTTSESPLYISFLLRVACGPYIASCRSAALHLLAKDLLAQSRPYDFQAILPYVAVCLSDPATSVRKSAGDVLIAAERISPQDALEDGQCPRWGSEDLFPQNAADNLKWMPSGDVTKIIQRVFLPVIEDCAMDKLCISQTLRSSLTGGPASARARSHAEPGDLKKGLRNSLFDLLTSHALLTPLYRVKIELLQMLVDIRKVGLMPKSRALLPLLQTWASLEESTAREIADRESLTLASIDRACVGIISAGDKDAILHLLEYLQPGSIPRDGILSAVLDRIETIWKDLKPEIRMALSQTLFELSFSTFDGASAGARNVLLSVSLPLEVLSFILSQTTSAINDSKSLPPISKRRRNSAGHSTAVLPQGFDANALVSRLSFALELIENSQPERNSDLLGDLFQTLAILHQIKPHLHNEIPYLFNLCLGCILAIIVQARSSTSTTIDRSVIRTELVTDCVQNVENPQVQNTALLLVAALTAFAPERILHNVMPIFTFMSKSVLAKDDDHSVRVINETIDQVLPPLIATLQKQRKEVITGVSELVSSFTTAFDHIPQHRRLALFERLVSRLGAEAFLYVVLSMLAARVLVTAEIQPFLPKLLGLFPIRVQLSTISKMLDVIADAMQPEPSVSKHVLGLETTKATGITQTISNQISIISYLLQSVPLKESLKKGFATKESSSATALKAQLAILLEQVLLLQQQVANDGQLQSVVSELSNSLLSLPVLAQYFSLAEDLLDRGDLNLQRQSLWILESRLSQNVTKNTETYAAAIGFMPILTEIIRSDQEISLKRAALACIDRISDHYGRKDTTPIINAARAIAGDSCLGSSDPQLRTTSLLCLASMVEILKEAVIPVLGEIMTKLFSALADSMQEETEDEKLHVSAYSFLSAVVSQVPFMISDAYLERIFVLSAESSYAGLGVPSLESRQEALNLVARKLDLKQIVLVLSKTWPQAVENDLEALKEALNVLSTSIDHASKSSVAKHSDSISSFATQVFDLRRIQLTNRSEDSYTEKEVEEVELTLSELLVKFIYKLNDTVFRPIFEQWVEWAVLCPDLDSSQLAVGTTLRQTALFNFSTHFFNTLKSIVTSYSSYIVPPAIEVLNQAVLSPPASPDDRSLYKSTLSVLRAALTHDMDAYFATPATFDPLSTALASQLHLAASKSFSTQPTGLLYSHVMPTSIALAQATVDQPSQHAALAKLLCRKELRFSSHAPVRLASIRTLLAISQDGGVGDDFVNNVVDNNAGAAEVLVYVNEMLEDDDEAVERDVRRWVHLVRHVTGQQDLFEV